MGLESTAPSPGCTARAVWWNLLWPTDVSPCISLCLWMGVVIHWVSEFLLRALWDGQWGQPQRICMWDLHQPGSNSELSKAHSGTQLSTDWRSWANSAHDITLLGSVSQPQALSGWVGFGALCSTEETASSSQLLDVFVHAHPGSPDGCCQQKGNWYLGNPS